MRYPLNDGLPVTINDILAARDRRAAEQQRLLAQSGLPVISLTINIPGAHKASRGAAYIYYQAMRALRDMLTQQGFLLVREQEVSAATGREALLIVNAQAETLKRRCIELEESAPLARLWDLDVLCPTSKHAISRGQLGLAPRRCLSCDRPAKECARSKQHSHNELLQLIDDYIVDSINKNAHANR